MKGARLGLDGLASFPQDRVNIDLVGYVREAWNGSLQMDAPLCQGLHGLRPAGPQDQLWPIVPPESWFGVPAE